MHDPIPLTILTGFLGSGKTTLLRRTTPAAAAGRKLGIIVNEFGEVGLDQDLLVHAADEVEVLAGGCLCCARRGDIARSLHELIRKARIGGAAWIDEAVLETSGLADPAPIIATILQDPWLRNNVRLKGVIAVLDAVAGPENLSSHEEARRQIAIADAVVITKTDLREASDVAELRKLIGASVPDARVFESQDQGFSLAHVLGALESENRDLTVQDRIMPNPVPASHGAAADSFVLSLEGMIDWPVFTVWLSALLHAHGDRILRVKGRLWARSTGKPLIVHGVQHMMHPPVHLDAPAGDTQKSWLVFITRGLARQDIEASLTRFLAQVEASKRPMPSRMPAF